MISAFVLAEEHAREHGTEKPSPPPSGPSVPAIRQAFAVTMAANGVWPGPIDERPGGLFRWVKIDNRGPGTVQFGWTPEFKRSDLLASAGTVDAGTVRVFNTGTPVDGLFLSSESGSSVRIEIDYARIEDSIVRQVGSSGTTHKTNVNSTAAQDVLILASNPARLQAYVYNDSTQICYFNLGSDTASSTNYTCQLPPLGYFQLDSTNLYLGDIRGIWAAANGAARVTECT